MNNVTADEVKTAMIAANISKVDCRNCSLCGATLRYYRDSESLYFDSGCRCTSINEWQSRSWQSVADWINGQHNDQSKIEIAARFGLSLQPGREGSTNV